MRILATLFFLTCLCAGSLLGGNFRWSQLVSSLSFSSNTVNFGEVDENGVQQIASYLNVLPERDKKAWVDYLRRASRIHSGSNETLEIANLRLMQNPCFSDLAAEYYGWLMEQDLSAEGLGFIMREERPLGAKPTLKDSAGSGKFAAFKPGTLWLKALDVAKGDTNVAMALIGLCGHDDAVHIKPKLASDRASTFNFRDIKKAQLKKIHQALAEYIRLNPQIPNAKEFLEFINSFESSMLSPTELDRLVCPNSSVLYLPKGLGEKFDISSNLKSEIVRVQSATKNPLDLPAKAYHVLASAVNACHLKSQAASTAFGSLLVNPIAARLYRAKTLAGKIHSELPIFLEDYPFENLNEEMLADIVSEFNKLPIDNRSEEERQGPLPQYLKFFSHKANKIAHFFPRREDQELTPALAYKTVMNKLTELDSATLARKWWTRAKFPLVGEVYLPSTRNRPEVRDAGPLSIFGLNNPDRCEEKGWSKARCEKAIEKLDTWEVDFKWTQEQHYLGALFGYANCRTFKADESLDSLACKALSRSRPK